MHQFPLFMNLAGRVVLVSGGGEAAAAKLRLLSRTDAVLRHFTAETDSITPEESAFAVTRRGPVAADFVGVALAIVADEDEEEAKRVTAVARAAGVPVNAVDRPELSDVYIPSIVDRGEVVVAIGTSGAAPVLARRLRAQIEALLPQRLGELAAFARAFRGAVAARLAPSARRAFWERVFDGPIAAKALAGDDVGAEKLMQEALNHPHTQNRGVVNIVGAGPGDPDLLTLRALRLLQDADVVIYDRLVGPDILGLVRRDAERIFVGKRRGDHAVPQRQIEKLMIDHARAGKRVVRLKGGDPFIFGRGGEELQAMRAAGVEAAVTPGVTAALGCAAAIGAPLTHRTLSQAVTFATGYAEDGGEPDLDWGALARLGHTLAIYMGAGRARSIADRLIEGGANPETPVAIIENGARADQRVLFGALDELGTLVEGADIEGPALLLIGDVVSLAESPAIQNAIVQRRAA